MSLSRINLLKIFYFEAWPCCFCWKKEKKIHMSWSTCREQPSFAVQYSLWYLPMLVTRYLSFRLNLWADAVTRLNLLRTVYTVHNTRSAEHDRFQQSISSHITSAIKIELQAWADTRENTVFEIYSFPAKHSSRKKSPFWSLHFSSAFFHKISSNVSRNTLKIQTGSYFPLTMSKWPISTAKL